MTDFDAEMMKALEADGDKLRQMTGEDHGPVFFNAKQDELKPCPFCGGPAEIWRANEDRKFPAWIACMGRCAVLITKEHKTDQDAISAWNTRA